MKILFLLLLPTLAFADTANISYTAPTERESGAPISLSEIAGYNVYLDGIPVIDLNPLPAIATSFTLTVTGNQALTMTTLDTDGREGVMSLPITVNGGSAPKPPSSITITITF